MLLKVIFFIKKKIAKVILANTTLRKTSGMAETEIRAPRIAVKPQIKTIKCK